MATSPNSAARDVVESYPATGEMYPEVVKALKTRFGRDDLLTEFYIRELLKLIIHNSSNTKKIPMSELYDKLQCHLRNLETLGVSPENCSPILLPLVSSCLPEDILKLWERSSAKPSSSTVESKALLENLLSFLKSEIEGEQRVKLAVGGFGLTSKGSRKNTEVTVEKPNNLATASGLYSAVKSDGSKNCIFCSMSHKAQDCIKAQAMSLEERRSAVSTKRACFCCLKLGHIASRCKNKPRCILCKKSHFVLMCDQSKVQSKPETSSNPSSKSSETRDDVKKSESLANLNPCNVLLQTLRVNVRGPNGIKTVRALIDSASQRSYILSSTASMLGYTPKGKENVRHSLFGGNSTDVICHDIFEVRLSSVDDSYSCHFDALDQSKICGNISSTTRGPWIDELSSFGIILSDVNSYGPIEVLIGADVAGKLMTGGVQVTDCGLVSVQTKLGWTLMGKLPVQSSPKDNLAVLVTTMLSTEAKISDLWSLDSLGIRDPYEVSSKHELETETTKHFLETVKVTDEGRFEVCLPWIENHPPLPDNYNIASKRLSSTKKKLENEGLYDVYQSVFHNWLEEEIIEEVPASEISKPAHYLPHHHVVKPGSTTPVRPVFDASAHEYKSPSLNQCLVKGPNLLEKIPSVMARFRLKKVGAIADIRKAFLQIVLNERDRDFLRFLWTTKNGESKVYRHCRVVFGICSSPFLLEASINLHLEQTLAKCKQGKTSWPTDLVQTLASSFYVDNCVCSLESEEQAQCFVKVASDVMNERKFELRGWELTSDGNQTSSPSPSITNVLGLLWDKKADTLEVNLAGLKDIEIKKVTKRTILSTAHRIFDPIGFTCCVTLLPKLLLQRTWIKGMDWDEEVEEKTKKVFLKWLAEIPCLEQVKIPRWAPGTNSMANWSLHIFSDACQTSYSSVAYLRVELEDIVCVQLISAKSRVSPISKSSKKMTIPRLELLAASISARLSFTVNADFGLNNVRTYFWTDSTTVLAWINRNDSWNQFVGNRVAEIKKLTNDNEWRYVPGAFNPADLPSRGCSAKQLLESKWWEGPSWLQQPPKEWPVLETHQYNEEDINSERKKSVVSALNNDSQFAWSHGGCSTFKKTVRMIGWMYRFKNNALTCDKRKGDLSCEEYSFAEKKLLFLIQTESFLGVNDPKLSSLIPFEDNEGLVRVKTKVSHRDDVNDFCYPIVLPSSSHQVVFRLIMDIHKENCHVGSQMIMSILRQRFWVLGGRRSVKYVLSQCVVCKRHSSKGVESIPTPLHLDRVRNTKVFEITGVDLTGPLYLKSGQSSNKAWVCLFTCSVYRAVHLELLSSLSTDCFLMGLRRFISRRGRPSIVYSDNATNFTGADNILKNLDWNLIENYSSVRRIQWKFSPPTAPWWGGWWERLVGILKKLLRKVLRNSLVTEEEMRAILCDCEAIINSRPLTYVSEDPSDLTPLTPSLFLQDIEEVGVPDIDQIETTNLNQRLKYRQTLKRDLRERFRSEYLGQLQLHANQNRTYKLSVGEVVLVGNDGLKRLNWPLARIVDLIRGKDGNVRLVRLKTQKGEITRPVQRIFPLEVKCGSTEEEEKMVQERLRKTTSYLEDQSQGTQS